MNDGSKYLKTNSLLHEWSILIQSFIEEDTPYEKSSQPKGQRIDFDDIKSYSRHLSQKRKDINKKIEEIKAAIENCQSTLENLILVHSETSAVLNEIEELNHQGEVLSQEMIKIDQKVRSLRIAEAVFLSDRQSA